MKCKPKDCPGCVHFINIRTHPLFKDFIIKSEDGKIIEFEGCMFHLQVIFQRQTWVRLIGVEAALETHRNEDMKLKQGTIEFLKKTLSAKLLADGGG